MSTEVTKPAKGASESRREVWKYKRTSSVKHWFSSQDLNFAACGVSVYKWKNDSWHDDPVWLKKLPKCKRCKKIQDNSES